MKFIKHPKKIHFILATLFVLNVAAFFTVSALTANNNQETSATTIQEEPDSYIESGVEVLNWSYSLIRYFRHPG